MGSWLRLRGGLSVLRLSEKDCGKHTRTDDARFLPLSRCLSRDPKGRFGKHRALTTWRRPFTNLISVAQRVSIKLGKIFHP
jgi:hypothetical protein